MPLPPAPLPAPPTATSPKQGVREALEALPQEVEALGGAKETLPEYLLQSSISEHPDKVRWLCCARGGVQRRPYSLDGPRATSGMPRASTGAKGRRSNGWHATSSQMFSKDRWPCGWGMQSDAQQQPARNLPSCWLWLWTGHTWVAEGLVVRSLGAAQASLSPRVCASAHPAKSGMSFVGQHKGCGLHAPRLNRMRPLRCRCRGVRLPPPPPP